MIGRGVALVARAGGGARRATGINFLPFTESAGAIWATTSIPESLRLMGYWLSYLGVGFGGAPLPYFDASADLLFSPPVVVASLLVPGARARRARLDAALALRAVLPAAPARRAAGHDARASRRARRCARARHVRPTTTSSAVQFLRTTYKAGPARGARARVPGGRAAARGCGGRAAGARRRGARRRGRRPRCSLALAAWPLATGRAVDAKFTCDEIPPAWEQAARRPRPRARPNATAR